MNYLIQRDGQQYGPYSLADLQRYVASGEISLTDLATSEASAEPIPVWQIVGNVAVAAPAVHVRADAPEFPNPPNLHWGLVLLFDFMSCGLFAIAWDLVQAVWLKKMQPTSKALYYYIGVAGCILCIFFASFIAGMTHARSLIPSLFQFVSAVLVLFGRFSFRASMEEHFNSVEPMGLSLSGVMTFFFGGIYFQYHINDIVRRKQQELAFQIAG
jgi:uncharacterized membrane protein YuzA (DUF378 family)